MRSALPDSAVFWCRRTDQRSCTQRQSVPGVRIRVLSSMLIASADNVARCHHASRRRLSDLLARSSLGEWVREATTTFGRNPSARRGSTPCEPLDLVDRLARRSRRGALRRRCPCFNCIICTGAPCRRATSVARSSPRTGISLRPAACGHAVGRCSPITVVTAVRSEQRAGPGSVLALEPREPAAVHQAVEVPSACRPRGRASRSAAASGRSPAMDFTGYRKIASTCPISMSMLGWVAGSYRDSNAQSTKAFAANTQRTSFAWAFGDVVRLQRIAVQIEQAGSIRVQVVDVFDVPVAKAQVASASNRRRRMPFARVADQARSCLDADRRPANRAGRGSSAPCQPG